MNKKQIFTSLVLSVFIFNSLSLGFSQPEVNSPKIAGMGDLDFIIEYSNFDMDYCNEFILATATVSSQSDSIPCEVMAEINGFRIRSEAELVEVAGVEPASEGA